jgi:hypothetical protein
MNPVHTIPSCFFKIQFNIIILATSWSSFIQVILLNFCLRFSSLINAISLSCPYEAFRYALFSSLLLLPPSWVYYSP